MKQKTKAIASPKKARECKYRIAELLRMSYGELNIKEGITALARHCRLKNERTVTDWLRIEAGSSIVINHLVLPSVLTFFSIQTESQLFTNQHKALLNDTVAA